MLTDDPDCPKRYARLIDRVLLGDLKPRLWQTLRAHLTSCPRCRDRYDRVTLAERMLHGGPAGLGSPSPSEIARVGAALWPPARAMSWQRLLQWFRPTMRWAGALAVAAAIVLLPFAWRAPRPAAVPPEGLQARGVSSPPGRQAGLRAFCLMEDGAIEPLDPLTSGSRKVAPGCRRAGHLKLTVTNPGGYRRLFLVGMDSDHELKWYAPRPPSGQSVAAPVGAADEPVGGAVKLAVNHAPGPVRIFALFSDEPVVTAEVEAAVGDLAKRGLGPASAPVLPLARTDVLQRSVLVEIEP